MRSTQCYLQLLQGRIRAIFCPPKPMHFGQKILHRIEYKFSYLLLKLNKCVQICPVKLNKNRGIRVVFCSTLLLHVGRHILKFPQGWKVNSSIFQIFGCISETVTLIDFYLLSKFKADKVTYKNPMYSCRRTNLK